METRANHVLIGAVTLIGLALMLAFGLWSARYQADAAWQDYEIRFDQAVTGLSVGSTVQYNGINMGSVRELSLDPDNPRRVIAVVRLQADTPVREDTEARLTLSGLTGVAFIQLRGGSPESPPLTAEPGEERPYIMAEESPLQRLLDASEDIAGTASEVMLRLLDFLSEENAERVSGTLDNIDALTLALTEEQDTISEVLANARDGSAQLVEVLDGANRALAGMVNTLERVDTQVMDRLPAMGDDLGESLERFASLAGRLDRVVAENEAALSEIGADALGQLGPAMDEFRQLVRELSRLSSRFERHPTRFLFGGDQPEEYRPR